MSEEPENLAPDVMRTWLHNRRIVVMKLSSHSHAAIDVFVDTIITLLNEWNADQPILILYDLRYIGFSLYLRNRSEAAARETPDRDGRAAFVLSYSTMQRIIRYVIMTRFVRKTKLQRQIFFDYDEALEWLQEPLK